jgi:predicted amidohydrolase
MLVGAYALWCRTGRGTGGHPDLLRIKYVSEYGKDSGKGNVLAVQPFMLSTDYSNHQIFSSKLANYLTEARKRGLLNRKTVVVFPEYIGTWLVVAGEKRGRYYPTTVDGAMGLMIASNPISFARALSSARGSDRVRDALFRMKAKRMAEWYDSVFTTLATEFDVTIVAGSIILPSPKIVDGRLRIGDGPLYNVSVVYRPDGKAYQTIVVKSYPTKDEQSFISAGKVEDLPVFDTPAGRLGVLICADAWFPQAYDVMKAKKASVVVVPSYGLGDAAVLKRKWPGYSGHPNPKDVAADDPGKIEEWQAFLKYSLPGRLPGSGIPNGAVVSLRGNLWNLGSHGTTTVVRKGKVEVAPFVDGAALVSLWL